LRPPALAARPDWPAARSGGRVSSRLDFARNASACKITILQSHLEHKAQSPRQVTCAVLSISDTRTEDTDTGGQAIVSLLTGAGHRVAARRLVRDEPEEVRAFVESQMASEDVQVVITTGGTGISSRDRTYDAISRLLDVTIDGFGELFRMLSYEEVGPAAMLSRASAGLAGRTVVIMLPGSEAAVRLAMTRLVLPELGHLVREAQR
jgi:molybdenum cofactor biosynthesis protein B